jgi:DNA-binding NtrC family response regulator
MATGKVEQPRFDPKADPRVLIVEDETRLRELLHRAMTGWGFEVAAARSGEEALRVADLFQPGIVVLDLNLPGMDGLECFEKLRQRLPDVQGIVLTGFASIEAAKKAIHLDVVEFLTKPCHLGELEQALDRAIRRATPVLPTVILPESAEDGNEGTEGLTLDEVERRHILSALGRNAGNRTATAAELGISRRTLYYKLEEYQKQGYDVG